MLSIQSTSSNRELRIRRGKAGYFIAEVLGHVVTAVTEVWIDADILSLSRFFVDLGNLGHPWNGKREWASLEGDFVVSAACTSLGSVTFSVLLAGLPGAPEEWSVTVGIETEFGQLSRIGREAQDLHTAGGVHR